MAVMKMKFKKKKNIGCGKSGKTFRSVFRVKNCNSDNNDF